MLFLTVVLATTGIVVGLVRGGSLQRLANLTIRWPWLAFAAWLLQVLVFVSPWAGALDAWTAPLYLASMLLIGVTIAVNRGLPGLALLGLGLVLNGAVVAANGGFMPASDRALNAVGSEAVVDALRDGGRIQKSILMQPGTPLWFLGDVIPVEPLHKVYSPGDLLAAVGIFVLVIGGMGSRTGGRAATAAPHGRVL